MLSGTAMADVTAHGRLSVSSTREFISTASERKQFVAVKLHAALAGVSTVDCTRLFLLSVG